MKREITAVLVLTAFFLCLPASSSAEEVLTHAEYVDAETDPYNVGNYDDPELFYDDNYLDFDSFEDAEVYWDDAQ